MIRLLASLSLFLPLLFSQGVKLEQRRKRPSTTEDSDSFLWFSDFHNLPKDAYNATLVASHTCKCFTPSDTYRCSIGNDSAPKSTCMSDSDSDSRYWGQYGCDPPSRLTNEAYKHGRSLYSPKKSPQFVLSTGDNAAHYTCYFPPPSKFPDQTADEQVLGIIRENTEHLKKLAGAFDSELITLDSSAGNNDVCPDYVSLLVCLSLTLSLSFSHLSHSSKTKRLHYTPYSPLSFSLSLSLSLSCS